MALEVEIEKHLSGFHLQVRFSQEQGCLGLFGASGCGKSMTLKCIAGIEKPDRGRIVLDGEVLFDSEKKICLRPQQRNIGYLFQNYALFPTMTVEENIGISIKEKAERQKKTQHLIHRFQLQNLEKRYPHQLSGGQQQRVAFARMLAAEPKLLLLDEPFSALDGYLKDTVHQEILKVLREFDRKVILVSHSREEMYVFCNQMAVMEQGKNRCVRKMQDVFQNPETVSAARLTGLKNISRLEKREDGSYYASDWGIQLNFQREVPDGTGYIGIRGHHLLTKAGPDNIAGKIRIRVEDLQETPFENRYLLKNADADTETPIWWMRQKKDFQEDPFDNLPKYLFLPENAVLFLQ